MRQVFEDDIELALCPECECEYVDIVKDHFICSDCKVVIL